MTNLVENKLTPLEPRQAAESLWRALSTVCRENGDDLGATPERALEVIVAHTAHETGRWQKMHCFNFGNIKAGPRYKGVKCSFRAWEILLGRRVEHVYHWRAYADADAGALGYLRYIGTDTDGGGNRYELAWEAALAGDPRKFALELKLAGYYTDDSERYALSLAGLALGFSSLSKEVSRVRYAAPVIDPQA
jgi:hypothetical protein